VISVFAKELSLLEDDIFSKFVKKNIRILLTMDTASLTFLKPQRKLKYFVVFLFILSLGSTYGQTKPKLFINEIMASNLSTFPDMVDFGDFSDWIEIYNDELTPVDISGFYISDDYALPTKWQFPTNTIIPAKGYYLVWADGSNDVPGKTYIREWWPNNIQYTTKWCHTNFKLNKGGDGVGLYDATGAVIDTLSFSFQTTDVSFGRQPDGSANVVSFGESTPLASNTTSGYSTSQASSDVIFSYPGGFYSSSIQLSLTPASGTAIIKFTLDGTQPTSASLQYISPITVDKNTVVRARCYEVSKLPGKIITNSYFINEPRTLPSVSFVTDPTFLWDHQLGIYFNSYKNREIPISLEYFPLGTQRGFVMDAGAKIGGENIFRFAEKPLNIYARSDYGYPHINYQIFDELPFVEYKQLYLRNGGDDWPNAFIRDGFLQTVLDGHIVNPMMAFKPSVLYINGKYWGLYDLREKIDDQYFLLHYHVDPANLDHIDDTNAIITGDSTDYVNLLSFASTHDLSDSINYNYVTSKIDSRSIMDFVVVQDYIANTSWGHNREMWRDAKDSKRWQWILVDMDRGFYASRMSANQIDDIMNNFGLFSKLMTNSNFKNEFLQRYAYHLNHTFKAARVVNKIDSVVSLLNAEMPRHVQRWSSYIDSLTIDIWGKTPGIPSYTYWLSEIQKLRDFAQQRPAYASQIISTKFGLSGMANLLLSSNIQNEGKITVNDSYENLGEVNSYFKNVPVKVQVIPPPGYGFKQWKEKVVLSNLTLLPSGYVWKYFDLGMEPSTTWMSKEFNDVGWKTGFAQFGYGDGDERTVISYGPDAQNKYVTSYYRTTFQVQEVNNISQLTVKLLRDDGAVVYLNGIEVARSNMPSGTITYNTYASSVVGDAAEVTFYDYVVDKNLLVNGTNIIAVEIHQSNATSSDVSFDLSLEVQLHQQNYSETVVGTTASFDYTLSTDAELIAEFEKNSSSELAQNINEPVTLALANSPYFVSNDVVIGNSGVVTVEPGVTINFLAGKNITVHGKLLMQGTTNNPITLTSYYPNEKWGAICFENSIGVSELFHVNIANATNGTDTVNFFAAISSLNATVKLDNIHFNFVKLPISTQWSDMSITNCIFENVYSVGDYINCNGGNISIVGCSFYGNAIDDMDAIDLGFQSGITEIKDNLIRDFTGNNSDGIDIGDESVNVVISGNTIINCSDKGVSVGQGSKVIIFRNSISHCTLGAGIKDSASYADISNCTFYKNDYHVSCFEKVLNRGGGTAEVKNSVFANAKTASFFADAFSKVLVNYSISNTDSLAGQNNLFEDPRLINPTGSDYHLQVNSPCINSGDPTSPFDPDGSVSDLGACIAQGVGAPEVVINEINYNSSPTFDSGDWLELYNNSSGAIDLSGWVFMDDNLVPAFVIPTGTNLAKDSYLVICFDLSLFTSKYSSVQNLFGNMSSGLSGNGEIIFLYNNKGELIDSLTYKDKSPWPTEGDGAGSSIELVNPERENAIGANWAASIGHGTPGEKNSTFVTAVAGKGNEIPTEFGLLQNYPNPFNPETTIEMLIAAGSKVSLKIYDVLGNEVATLLNEHLSPGKYTRKFRTEENKQLASGIYFSVLTVVSDDARVNKTFTKKMLLLK